MWFCTRIFLLVWKNFLFRKKHYCATAWFIILPTFVSMVVGLYYGSLLGPKVKSEFSIPEAKQKEVVIIKDNIQDNDIDFIRPLIVSRGKKDFIEIAYAPKTSETSEVMEKLKTGIEGIIRNKTILTPVVELIPYESHAILEKATLLWKNNPPNFIAAIIFRDKFQSDFGLYRYTIRMKGIDFVTESLLLPPLERYYVIKHDHGSNFTTHHTPQDAKEQYETSGFRALQILLDKIIVKIKVGGFSVPKIELQEFESQVQGYSSDAFPKLVPHILVLSFILCVPNIMRGIVHEKQSGIKELMKMMGLSNWMHWAGWMIDSLFFLIIIISIMTFFLFHPFYESVKGLVSCNLSLWFSILTLYLMATVTSLFFVSTFFGKPSLAIIAGICFHIVSYYGLVFVLDKDASTLTYYSTLIKKLASSLLPNMALHWALKIIIDRNSRGSPIEWSNITEPLSSLDKLNLLAVGVMLVVDIILYMLLTVYFENVIPSEFGLRKPWYYPLYACCCCCCSSNKVGPVESERSARNAEAAANVKLGFEEEPTNLPIGIEIRNLSKKFRNKKVAVDGLSAKMYAGEITALLGHNGAGKTTTLSILTGVFKPSSGTAFINGYNIANRIGKIRKFVGLCPQHDLLFDELTVSQHLQFFGMLKGLSWSMAKQEAHRILFSLKLGEKSRNLASTLSGGQKRRLSLANAIIGGSSVLFLDEPTSGLDPEARREVWDLLLALRSEGRTIVLTTHFMEEADVLGDRILIMAEGKLQCSGTPLFLKKCFGDGYTLTVTLTDKADRNSILSVVQKYISSAFFKKGVTKTVSEVAITLPEESTKTSIFPDMFSYLTKRQQKLGILTMGLTIPSIDDVFVRVGEISHPTEEVGINPNEDTSNGDNVVNVNGSSLSWLMFRGLMIKLFIRNIRNRRLLLLQILPPIVGAVIVAAISGLLFRIRLSDYPPLTIFLQAYTDPITVCMPMTEKADFMCDGFFDTIYGIGVQKVIRPEPTNPDLITYLKNSVNTNNKFKYVIAAEMKHSDKPEDRVIKVMHSGLFTHSEPLALNAASNTILKLKSRISVYVGKIGITNHPLRAKGPSDIITAAETIFQDNSKFITAIFDIMLPLPFAMLAASYLMFPSEERVCKGKHLQRMTGVSPFLYWVTSFLNDFLMMILVAFVMLICFWIFEPLGLYTSDNGAVVIFIVFLVYAFSVMPLSYLRSNFGSSPSEGFSGLIMLHIFTALFLANFTYFFEYEAEKLYYARISVLHKEEALLKQLAISIYTLGIVFRVLFIANPTFGLTMCLIKFASISIENNRCKLLGPDLDRLCEVNNEDSFQYLLSCCSTCNEGTAKCGTIEECNAKIPYLTWVHEAGIFKYLAVNDPYERRYRIPSPFDSYDVRKPICFDDPASKSAGIGQELFCMFVFGLIYYILLLLMEYGLLARIKEIFRSKKLLVEFQANYPTDEDVIAEAERVHATVFRPKSQMVGNMHPTTDSANVAPQVATSKAEALHSGDKNEDDEQQNELPPSDKQDTVEIQIEEDSLVVQNLCKSFKSFAAVSNISFGVKHGECFGLLGVNGAGKTTTFRMLTGDEFPSDGDAYAVGFSLKNNKNDFVKQFGYCPQFDPLIGFMTGREMLNFYGRLRGVPPASLKRETSKWLDKLGLTDAGNRQCKTYSGGMKRRLSAGLGLIGNPPIILLDEPTSGVDPVCRRQFWKIISSVKDAGQAVIFTSHSMDECEALCSRLGIMVNGQFQCFGGAPHIKAKFGEGYSLTIKLKSYIPAENVEEGTEKVMNNSKAVADLQEEIFTKYQKVFLKEVHTNIMQYQLLDGSMTWDVVFKIMEEIKTKHEIIDEYSIGETTLEQVFLTFARQQYGARVA